MRLRLVTAGGSADWEVALVEACQQPDCPAEVVQRCYDLGDLLAVTAAGQAQVALVAGTHRWLDREAVGRLAGADVAVVGVIPPGQEDLERRLRQVGVDYLAWSTDAPEVLIGWAHTAMAARPAAPEPAAAEPQPAPADSSELPAPAGGGPRVLLAVWGPKGAPGRTTLAVNLAFEAVPLVGDTLLVDADTYGGTVDQKLGFLDDYPGLAWAARLASRGELDVPRLWQQLRLASPTGPRVLVGLSRAALWTEVRPPTWEALLDLFAVAFPVTVVDLGFCLEEDEELTFDQVRYRRNAVARLTLARADLVVAVARGDQDGLREFILGYQELRELVPAERIRVVVNQVRGSVFAGDPIPQIREPLVRYLGVDPAAYIPYDRAGLDAALMVGRALRESRRGSAAQASFATLTAQLLQAAGLLVRADPPTANRRRRRWGARRQQRRAALEDR